MPWQGDLFIGKPVKDEAEALAVYKQLGIEPEQDSEALDGTPIKASVFDGLGKTFKVDYRGRELDVYVYAMQDTETCERAVAFNLTGRYKGQVLDVDCVYQDGHRKGEPSGRTDPFVFDPQDLVYLLEQVRGWWPEAQVFIWDRFH